MRHPQYPRPTSPARVRPAAAHCRRRHRRDPGPALWPGVSADFPTTRALLVARAPGADSGRSSAAGCRVLRGLHAQTWSRDPGLHPWVASWRHVIVPHVTGASPEDVASWRLHCLYAHFAVAVHSMAVGLANTLPGR